MGGGGVPENKKRPTRSGRTPQLNVCLDMNVNKGNERLMYWAVAGIMGV